MKKKMLMSFFVLFLLFAVSALASNSLTLSCPASADVESTIDCSLSFSNPQSLLAIAGTLTIPPQLDDSVTFTALPGSITGMYVSATGRFSIDDMTNVVGAADVTTIGTLTFTSVSADPDVKVGIVVDAASTIDQNFAPISLLGTSIESNSIAISPPGVVPGPVGASCALDSDCISDYCGDNKVCQAPVTPTDHLVTFLATVTAILSEEAQYTGYTQLQKISAIAKALKDYFIATK